MRSVGVLAALVIAGEAAAFSPLDPLVLLRAVAVDAAFVDRLGAEGVSGDAKPDTSVAVDQRAMRNASTSGAATL
ncbi:MAG: hypothetical protein FJX67_14275 [Alphaproteobacteria bacterium]|nr:hypothetical protein [Alphaproteobacteria bacterium]